MSWGGRLTDACCCNRCLLLANPGRVLQLTVLSVLITESSGVGGKPPLPVMIKELPPAIRLFSKPQRSLARIASASTRIPGNSFKPEVGSTWEMLRITSPLKDEPRLEVEVMSFSGVRRSRNSKPKMPLALISTRPPSPWSALAMISLSPRPTRVSVSINILPPVVVF
ncbi:MAG: hypothetical protein F6K56_37535 [Moorea sp. SIO3G5]|nr:hypothetical protein [Moorena sp. SIO3G5]